MTRTRYAALWCDDGSTPIAGLVELGSTSLDLEGRSGDRRARRHVDYGEIRSFHLTRDPHERIRGRPAIVLDVGRASTLRVTSPEPGALHELLDTLTLATDAAAAR